MVVVMGRVPYLHAVMKILGMEEGGCFGLGPPHIDGI